MNCEEPKEEFIVSPQDNKYQCKYCDYKTNSTVSFNQHNSNLGRRVPRCMSKVGNLAFMAKDPLKLDDTSKIQKSREIALAPIVIKKEPIDTDTVSIKTEVDDDFGGFANEFEFVDPNLEIKKEENYV